MSDDGDVIPLSWYQDCLERFLHCSWCDSGEVLLLPETLKAEHVECKGCLQKGFIQFLDKPPEHI